MTDRTRLSLAGLLMALTLASTLASGCISSADVDRYNEQHYARLCGDQHYAHQTGHNAGLERRPLDTTWVDARCAPHVREAIRSWYVGGYREGIASAPAVQVVQQQPQTSSGADVPCRFSSDCGEGSSCRARSDGYQVCMGFGGVQDACWFGSDCLSGSCDAIAKRCR